MELRSLLVGVSLSRDPRLTSRAIAEVMRALRELGDGEPPERWNAHPVQDVVEGLTHALELVADAMDTSWETGAILALGRVGRHVNQALQAVQAAELGATGRRPISGSVAPGHWPSQGDLVGDRPRAPFDVAEVAELVAELAAAVSSLAGAVGRIDAVVRRQGEQLDSFTAQRPDGGW